MRRLCEVGGPVDVSNEPLTHMTVFPEASEVRDVAKLLLQLADSPRDVMTTLDPTIGFRVPAWLYETFVAVWDTRLEGGEVPDSSTEVLAESGTENIEVKRKPGRPRKEVK